MAQLGQCKRLALSAIKSKLKPKKLFNILYFQYLLSMTKIVSVNITNLQKGFIIYR